MTSLQNPQFITQPEKKYVFSQPFYLEQKLLIQISCILFKKF